MPSKHKAGGCGCCCRECYADYYHTSGTAAATGDIFYRYTFCLVPSNDARLTTAQNTTNTNVAATVASDASLDNQNNPLTLGTETIDGVLYQKASATYFFDHAAQHMWCVDSGGTVFQQLVSDGYKSFGFRWLASDPCHIFWYWHMAMIFGAGSNDPCMIADMIGGVGPNAYPTPTSVVKPAASLANNCYRPDAAFSASTPEKVTAGIFSTHSNPFNGSAIMHNTYGTLPGAPTAC